MLVTDQLPPRIIDPPMDTNSSLRGSENFTCKVEGGTADQISYKWYRDGILLPGFTQSYYYIQEITPERRGNYTCEAISSGGQVVSTPARVDIPGGLCYASGRTVYKIFAIHDSYQSV